MGSQLIIQLLSNIRFYNDILLFEFESVIKEIKRKQRENCTSEKDFRLLFLSSNYLH